MNDEQTGIPGVTMDDATCEITNDNALVVIARELRGIRVTLEALTFDPNLNTTLSSIRDVLNETLQTGAGDVDEDTIAGHVKRIADRT